MHLRRHSPAFVSHYPANRDVFSLVSRQQRGGSSVPWHTSGRGGTHCCPHIHLGQECPHHAKHPLDTRCLRPAYMGNGRKPHLHHHRRRPLRLPLWPVHQAHRGFTQRELEQLRLRNNANRTHLQPTYIRIQPTTNKTIT